MLKASSTFNLKRPLCELHNSWDILNPFCYGLDLHVPPKIYVLGAWTCDDAEKWGLVQGN
jgi:hypothetical protein